MTHVIGDSCIGTTDLSCIEVCPVDCIYEIGSDQEDPDLPLMCIIDAEECIDCGICIDECPVEAISTEKMVPEEQLGFITLGAMHVGRGSQSGPDEENKDAKTDIAEHALGLHNQLLRQT